MGVIELFLVAVGLSMDAFAVSVCKGLGMKRFEVRKAVAVALCFGGFQALMPLLGWLLGTHFQKYIVAVDHWVVFAILGIIGAKMICDSISDSEHEVSLSSEVDLRELLMLGVATSIDALAVGITFAFLNSSIVVAFTIIGLTTFIISIAGVEIGTLFGSKFEKKAEILGGIILILIGVKVLIEHLT